MVRLPFLIVHGATVWGVLVIAITIGVALRSRRHGWLHAAVIASITGAIAISALWGAGKLAMSQARITHRTLGGHGYNGARVAYDLGNLDALSLAAALPGSRDDALDELTGRFEEYYVRDAASLERWQRLARLRGGCAGELAMLRDQERIGELARLAPECSDDDEAAAALLFLGDYAGAARRTEHSTFPKLDAQIGTRAWPAVVRSVAAFRERLARGDARSLYTMANPDAPTQIAPRIECGELYFRIRAGEPDAAGKLHAAVGRDPFCKLIDALARPLDQQGAALLETYPSAPDAQAGWTIEALAWAAGAPVVEHVPLDRGGIDPRRLLELSPIDSVAIRPAILAPFATAARHDPEGSPAADLTRLWHAQYAMLHGDLRAATAEATTIERQASPVPPSDTAEIAPSFAAALALRAGAPLPDGLGARAYVPPGIRDVVELARGGAALLNHGLPLASHECIPSDAGTIESDALASAIGGDGGPLADLIDRCAIRAGLGMAAMFGLWPRIHSHRERLRAQLAVAAPDLFASNDPFDVIRRALLRRDLARLTGDTAGTTAWQGVIDRHLAVLADREVAVALVMWHLL